MHKKKTTQNPKRKVGRPARKLKTINATAEEIAQRFFANAKPPDPSIRVRNRSSK